MEYVLGDVHGCYDKFLEMLSLINFNKNDTMYIIGDIVDRGNRPIDMIKYVMSHENIKMILGNHEDMMKRVITTNSKSDICLWYQNGGEVTFSQYSKLEEKEKKDIFNFLVSLPTYFIVENYILVHAGIYAPYWDSEKSTNENMDNQRQEDLVWIRSDFYKNKTGIKDKTVIFGHTPVVSIDNAETKDVKIWYDTVFKDKICIDCGCVFGGRLACIRLQDMKEFYV